MKLQNLHVFLTAKNPETIDFKGKKELQLACYNSRAPSGTRTLDK